MEPSAGRSTSFPATLSAVVVGALRPPERLSTRGARDHANRRLAVLRRQSGPDHGPVRSFWMPRARQSARAVDAWPGDPAILDDVTPVRLTVENHSRRALRMHLSETRLVDEDAQTYAALPLYLIDGEAQVVRHVYDPVPKSATMAIPLPLRTGRIIGAGRSRTTSTGTTTIRATIAIGTRSRSKRRRWSTAPFPKAVPCRTCERDGSLRLGPRGLHGVVRALLPAFGT